MASRAISVALTAVEKLVVFMIRRTKRSYYVQQVSVNGTSSVVCCGL